MNYYCTHCIAKLVNKGKVKPVYKVWTNPPLKNNSKCSKCGEIGLLYPHPEIDKLNKRGE